MWRDKEDVPNSLLNEAIDAAVASLQTQKTNNDMINRQDAYDICNTYLGCDWFCGDDVAMKIQADLSKLPSA